MRSSGKKVNQILARRTERTLAQAIAEIKSPKEADTFLREFFTKSEHETFSKRLAIAYWLKKGRSYKNIKDNLKVSSATIAHVQEILDKDGIKLALKKLEADEWASLWSKKIKKFVNP